MAMGKIKSPLVFRLCNIWRGRGCRSISFPSSFGGSGGVLVPSLLPFPECLGPSGIRGVLRRGDGKLLALQPQSCGEKPSRARQAPGTLWDYGRDQQGTPRALLLVGDVTLPFTHPGDFIYPRGCYEPCV